MNKAEKYFLKKVVDFHTGLLAPVDLFRHNSDKIIHKLIAEGYIEEVPTTRNNKEYTYYRASQKGHCVFYPFHKKIWLSLKGDVRTVVVSVITSAITTVLAIYLTKLANQ